MEGLVLVLDTVFALTEPEGIDPIKSSFYLTRAQFYVQTSIIYLRSEV